MRTLRGKSAALAPTRGVQQPAASEPLLDRSIGLRKLRFLACSIFAPALAAQRPAASAAAPDRIIGLRELASEISQ